uniref:Cadherin domain-containing protein n=1 Tax=Panagrellus redivivus TaxID=6233 RepID=A0A7E4VLE1_PANRE
MLSLCYLHVSIIFVNPRRPPADKYPVALKAENRDKEAFVKVQGKQKRRFVRTQERSVCVPEDETDRNAVNEIYILSESNRRPDDTLKGGQGGAI